jgi:hypothetical protein
MSVLLIQEIMSPISPDSILITLNRVESGDGCDRYIVKAMDGIVGSIGPTPKFLSEDTTNQCRTSVKRKITFLQDMKIYSLVQFYSRFEINTSLFEDGSSKLIQNTSKFLKTYMTSNRRIQISQ